MREVEKSWMRFAVSAVEIDSERAKTTKVRKRRMKKVRTRMSCRVSVAQIQHSRKWLRNWAAARQGSYCHSKRLSGTESAPAPASWDTRDSEEGCGRRSGSGSLVLRDPRLSEGTRDPQGSQPPLRQSRRLKAVITISQYRTKAGDV